MSRIRTAIRGCPNWVLAAIGIAIAVLASVCRFANQGSVVWRSGTDFFLVPTGALSFVWAGLVARSRYGSQRMGLLLVFTGCAYSSEDIQLAPWTYLHALGLALQSGSTVGMIVIALVYPTGQLRARVDTWLVAITFFFGYLYIPLPDLLWVQGQPPSPLYIGEPLHRFDLWFSGFGIAVAGVVVTIVGVRVWQRIQAVTPARRWVMTPFTIALGAWVLVSMFWAVCKATGYGYLKFQADTIGLDELLIGVTMVAIPWGFLNGIGRLRTARFEAIEALSRLTPDAGFDDVTQTLRRTLREPELVLEIPGQPNSAPIPTGSISTPIGTAILHHDPVLGDDPQLLSAVGTAITSVLTGRDLVNLASQVGDELAATRRRLITALDETKTRFERNLHDGPQQRLVAAMLKLDHARTLATSGDLHEAAQAIENAERALADAIDELRALSHGEHPPVLRDFGLIAALQQLADSSELPTTLHTQAVGRAPAAVEVAAYYVAAEAYTNAARHAQASEISIEVEITEHRLLLRVRDDGIGGAVIGGGSGLLGLRDRVAAIDGQLELISQPGAGTTVIARLPITVAASRSPADEVVVATSGEVDQAGSHSAVH